MISWSACPSVFEAPSQFLPKEYSIPRYCSFVRVICVLRVIIFRFFRHWTSLKSTYKYWVNVNNTDFFTWFIVLHLNMCWLVIFFVFIPMIQWCHSLLCWIILGCCGLSQLVICLLDGTSCLAYNYLDFCNSLKSASKCILKYSQIYFLVSCHISFLVPSRNYSYPWWC